MMYIRFLYKPPLLPNLRAVDPDYRSIHTNIKHRQVCMATTSHLLLDHPLVRRYASQIVFRPTSRPRTLIVDVAGQSPEHGRQVVPRLVHVLAQGLWSLFTGRRRPFAVGQMPRYQQARPHKQYHISPRTAQGGSRRCIRLCRRTGMTGGQSCEPH